MEEVRKVRDAGAAQPIDWDSIRGAGLLVDVGVRMADQRSAVASLKRASVVRSLQTALPQWSAPFLTEMPM